MNGPGSEWAARRVAGGFGFLALLLSLAVPIAGQAEAGQAASRLRVPVARTAPAPHVIGAAEEWGGQGAGAPVTPLSGAAALAEEPGIRAPELRLGREVTLGAAGLGLLLAGEVVGVDTRLVPSGGLDPSEIAWGLDRRSLEGVDRNRLSASDWTLRGALALPVVAELVFGPGGGPGGGAGEGDPWSRALRSGVVYGEAVALAAGMTWLGKSLFSRARPYAYLPGTPDPPGAYDPSRDRAFRSMPSGHAALAWTGAATALTAHLLDRPGARWPERVSAGALAAGLATATALLRVRAGQHFPTDVLAGSGIGSAAGVAVTLLHRDGRPLPTGRALLETTGGMLAGSALALLFF